MYDGLLIYSVLFRVEGGGVVTMRSHVNVLLASYLWRGGLNLPVSMVLCPLKLSP
jgi:hypothetical protein